MEKRMPFIRIGLIMAVVLAFQLMQAQDKIYTIYGKVMLAKVTEVGPKQIKYTSGDNPNGPLYIMNETEIDSIVYANGKVDKMTVIGFRKNLTENIPELNTWNFDLFGFIYLTASQAYERRLKNGKVGFRVPLYTAFMGGGVAGEGTFKPQQGVFSAHNYYYNNGGKTGSAMATGLNVKCYLFKRRVVRAFAGPEATMGYTTIGTGSYNYGVGYLYNYSLITYGTVSLLGKVGLSFNPIDKFNITVDGGAGVGDIFGHASDLPSPVGFTGLWHIGLALGTNF